MRNINLYSFFFLTIFLLFSSTISGQDDKKKDKAKNKIKPYEEVITDKAITDEGLFKVHKVDDKYYFEIDRDILEKEILVVSRISGFVKNLNFGGAGIKSRPQQVIRWQKHDNQLLLRSVSYNSVASEELPIYLSVRNNNFEPIILAFPLKAIGKDSSSFVIEAGPLFTTDIPMLGAINKSQRKSFEVSGLDAKRSLISHIKSYPLNTEVRHVLTYKGKKLPDNQITNTLSVEMNQSFIKLPENPMMPRIYDSRVGYFSITQTDYGLDAQRAEKRRYITRWRLEPKDPEAFARGELVEPVKPIIYYIDPATPKEWAPYIKQGVDDWKKAFEKAGFKNAIMAKDPPSPEEDPEWSPEDVRYSVIRYITTDIQNAMGPHVHDPRTGEILESDIMWYHNVMNLLRNWFFIQTAAVNPEARGVKFKKEVMGELIRFVSAHEVGHTLGLPHNMGSSPAYKVDSLRSKHFTANHGTAPSIMDYARFNYVAQPEDGITDLYPRIGEYDDWSIIFGYKPIPGAKSPEEERATINTWIKDRADDLSLRFGAQRRNPSDPSAQTEDLGDDAMLASSYGVKNLKRIVPQLVKWSKEETKGYEQLAELYNNVYSQFGRYLRHVGTNVGGIYDYQKTADEAGVIYSPVPKIRQQAAVNFINEQLFQTPNWLIDNNILQRIQSDGLVDRLGRLQRQSLDRLFEEDRLNRLIETEALHGASHYTINNLFSDVRKGIFTELSNGKPMDTYRRNLQRAYIDKMKELMMLKDDKYHLTDIKAMARGSLNDLDRTLAGAIKNSRGVNRYHMDDLRERIKEVLDPNIMVIEKSSKKGVSQLDFEEDKWPCGTY